MVMIHSYYGSIPIKIPYFSGMNIHFNPAILRWTEGVQGFDTLPYVEIQLKFCLFGFLLDIFGVLSELFGSFWSDCHWSLAFFLEILCRDGEIEKIKEIVVEFWTLELRFRCLNGDMFFFWYLFRMGLFYAGFGESRHGFHMASPRPEPLN